MSLIIFILFVFLLLDYLKLKDRVINLEKFSLPPKVAEPDAIPDITPLPPLPFSHNRLTPFPAVDDGTVNFTSPATVSFKPKEFFLIRWFKEDALIKIGGIIFFLGVAWFVTYAVKAGWLSPGLRITFGLALALGAYALGYYRQVVSLNHYLVLTALGTGIMCATVLAAQIIFSIFNPVVALSLLSLSIGYTVYVSLLTNIRWLLLVAALAGLASPLLSGAVEDSISVLIYLLVLSTTLLLSGFKINFKPVILFLTIGVLFYENLLLTTTPANWLWFFVILFSALFFASVTLALVQQQKPQLIDVFVMLIVAVNFIALATVLTVNSSVATFIAAFVCGSVGYYLAERQLPNRVISIYIALATGLLVVGTSLLLSGYSLILAYIIEFTAAFLLVTYLGLPSLVVWTSALLYLLPFFGSLPLFISSSWLDGIWHPEAWVLYTMTGSFFASALWLIHKKTVSVYRWSKSLAAIFALLGFFYCYGVLGVVADSLFIPSKAIVMTYVSWGLLSLCVVFYTLRKNLSLRVTLYSVLSVIFPTIVSLESFSSSAWSLGFSHPDGFGVLGIFVIIFLITLLLVQRFCQEYDTVLRRYIAGFVILLVTYLFAIFVAYWQGVLTPALATVAIYISFMVTLYGLISLFVLLRTSVAWIGYSLVALALPIGLSLSSFSFTGFKDGVMSPQAVGLFALCVFFALLALGLRRHYAGAHIEDQTQIFNWSRILLGLTFIYAVSLTWCMAHTIVASEQAISLALFIYTMVGLFAYQYGKRKEKSDATYAGVALLSLVVMHLVLVDVWKMELIWQVITFLVIGTMFIATALVETKLAKSKTIKLP